MGQRLSEIDVMRGLAAIAVLTVHVCSIPLSEVFTGGVVLFILTGICWLGKCGRLMFVSLSGMGLMLSSKQKEGYFRFIGGRLWKILPGYVIWTIIYTLTLDNAAKTFSYRFDNFMPAFGLNLLTGGSCYHLYFVPRIIELYFIYPLLLRLLRLRYGIIIPILISSSVLCIRYCTGLPKPSPVVSHFYGTIGWLAYFAIGIWLMNSKRVMILRTHPFRLAVIFAIILFSIYVTVVSYNLSLEARDFRGTD